MNRAPSARFIYRGLEAVAVNSIRCHGKLRSARFLPFENVHPLPFRRAHSRLIGLRSGPLAIENGVRDHLLFAGQPTTVRAIERFLP
jgi:hypothetical protein